MLDKIKKFFHRLRSADVGDVAQAAREKWLLATEDSSLAKFVPEPVGTGSQFPKLPSPESAPESLKLALVQEAEEILAGKWRVFRGHVLETATPPAWHKDYLSGEENLTLNKARELDPDNMPGKMTARFVWELNRWSQITRLAQAFYLTGRDKFRKEAIMWLESWVQMNPAGRGWNWISPQETGIRLINLCWIDALVELPVALLTKLAPYHVWWTHRYREPDGGGSLESLAALAGLVCAAARWPKVQEWSAPLRELGSELDRQILTQFGRDGGHLDQSLSMHLFALEICHHARRAMESNEISLADEPGSRLAAAGSWFSALSQSAEPWMFGEGEGGMVVPLYAGAEFRLAEWRDWLHGHANSMRYWWGAAPNGSSDVMPTGYRMMELGDWLLRWDISPHGRLPQGEWSHLDALHISVWKDGQAVLVDAGPGFPGPGFHNGPHLMDAGFYPQEAGHSGWLGLHDTPIILDRVATLNLAGKVLRREVSIESDGWKISDRCDHPFAVHWLLSPEWEAWEHGSDEFVLFREGHSLTITVEGAQLELVEGMCCPVFGKKLSAPLLRCRALTGGEIITRLVSTRLL